MVNKKVLGTVAGLGLATILGYNTLENRKDFSSAMEYNNASSSQVIVEEQVSDIAEVQLPTTVDDSTPSQFATEKNFKDVSQMFGERFKDIEERALLLEEEDIKQNDRIGTLERIVGSLIEDGDTENSPIKIKAEVLPAYDEINKLKSTVGNVRRDVNKLKRNLSDAAKIASSYDVIVIADDKKSCDFKNIPKEYVVNSNSLKIPSFALGNSVFEKGNKYDRMEDFLKACYGSTNKVLFYTTNPNGKYDLNKIDSFDFFNAKDFNKKGNPLYKALNHGSRTGIHLSATMPKGNQLNTKPLKFEKIGVKY